jgi:hypothetical protein
MAALIPSKIKLFGMENRLKFKFFNNNFNFLPSFCRLTGESRLFVGHVSEHLMTDQINILIS